MSWTTLAEVTEITGKTCTAADLAAAQSVIEIHTNRTEDIEAAITPRDLYWLGRAVAWQAIWQAQQPGYEAQQSATSIAQDGLTVQRPDDTASVLAPLARRAVKNLSWMGARSHQVTTREPRGSVRATETEFAHDADPDEQWEPL